VRIAAAGRESRAATDRALTLVFAHQIGSAAFYWGVLADLLLPVSTALLLLAPRFGDSAIAARRFRLVGFGAAMLASLVTLAGKTLEVWPGNPLFPSGHTAYAVTIAVFLVGRDRRWGAYAFPLVCLLAVALVLARYHVAADVAGGLAVGLAVAIPLFAWLRRSESRRPSRGHAPLASG